jgi:hypothetical protein
MAKLSPGGLVRRVISAEMDNCYESFRLHCIAIHGSHPDDTESYMHFDLEKLMLYLLKTSDPADDKRLGDESLRCLTG